MGNPERNKKILCLAMPNIQVQKPRNLKLNASTYSLTPMSSDPEEVLHRTDDPLFYIPFQNLPHEVQEPATTLEATLESDGEALRPDWHLQRTDRRQLTNFLTIRVFAQVSDR